jgi:hypothetical protein
MISNSKQQSNVSNQNLLLMLVRVESFIHFVFKYKKKDETSPKNISYKQVYKSNYLTKEIIIHEGKNNISDYFGVKRFSVFLL